MSEQAERLRYTLGYRLNQFFTTQSNLKVGRQLLERGALPVQVAMKSRAFCCQSNFGMQVLVST
jgi:hypothetical protein